MWELSLSKVCSVLIGCGAVLDIYICAEHLVPAVGFSVQSVHHEPLISPWVLRAEKVDGHCIKHCFEGWAACCG